MAADATSIVSILGRSALAASAWPNGCLKRQQDQIDKSASSARRARGRAGSARERSRGGPRGNLAAPAALESKVSVHDRPTHATTRRLNQLSETLKESKDRCTNSARTPRKSGRSDESGTR